MPQVVIAVAVILGGIAVALLIRRRDSRQPASGANWSVPVQLHRSDFERPDAPRLIVVFSSATCDACAATMKRIEPFADAETVVQDVSYQANRKLHDRYGIDAVPTVVVSDAEGVVVRSFVGPPSDADLVELLTPNDVPGSPGDGLPDGDAGTDDVRD